MTTTKKQTPVAAAEDAVSTRAAELIAAKSEVERLNREHGEALEALRKARGDADASLPQCRLVRIHWRGEKPTDSGMLVILRKTPTGMIVARRVGEPAGSEYRFKWAAHGRCFRDAAKHGSWMSSSLELRDVPAEYMPGSEFASA